MNMHLESQWDRYQHLVGNKAHSSTVEVDNWGEPERAPHLMMSTAVCMLSSSYGKHLPEDELQV